MIEIKEYASELWNNLSKGLDALYEKYQTLTTRADADYKEQIDALDPAYRKLKNRTPGFPRTDSPFPASPCRDSFCNPPPFKTI